MKKSPKFKNDDKAFFTYKCLESEESCDVKLWHHSKQCVEIIRKLSKNEVDESEVGFMYKVKFDDGLKYDVFEDELKHAMQCNSLSRRKR